MRRLAALLALLFLLVDVYAFMIWWTHPRGARAMGFPQAGTLPFQPPFPLPLVTLPEGSDAAQAPPPEPEPPPAMPSASPAEEARRPEREPEPAPQGPAGRGDDPASGYGLDDDPFSKYEKE